jgi:hypothetical protein
MSHTPGPWRVENRGWWPEVVVSDTPRREITSIEGRSESEVFANARLIAAAPELLAALNEMVTLFDSRDHDAAERAKAEFMRLCPESQARLITARAAIAKAEGRA